MVEKQKEIRNVTTLCLRKKRHPLLFVITYSHVIQFCQFLEFEANTYAQHTTSQLCTFVLYLVKKLTTTITAYNTTLNIRDTALHSLSQTCSHRIYS